MNPKVFICHASEDKGRLVLDFATKLDLKGILADDSAIFSAVASAVNPTDAESGDVESVDKGVYKYRPEGHANLKKRRMG